MPWYIKDNSLTVLFGDKKDVEQTYPDAERIIDRPSINHTWDPESKDWVERSVGYRELRASAYPPIGDQLDAILKHLNYMQMSGQADCVKDLDCIIAKWLSVKATYPKDSE